MKMLAGTAVLASILLAPVAADARVCRNSHGRFFHCHQLLKPRIDLNKHHPVKILRCRGDRGKLNKC